MTDELPSGDGAVQQGNNELTLCVIKNAKLGFDIDYNRLSMSFSTYQSESRAAGQSIRGIHLERAFSDTRAPNVEWFNGRTCWCVIRNHEIHYVRMFKSS